MPTFPPPTPAEKEEMKREAAEKAAKEKAIKEGKDELKKPEPTEKKD
jgi:hypothetical protein